LLGGEFYKYPRSPFDFVTYKGEKTRQISFDITIQPDLSRHNLIEPLENLKKTMQIETIGYRYSCNPMREGSSEFSQSVLLNDREVTSNSYRLEGNALRHIFTFPKELENQPCSGEPRPLDSRTFHLTDDATRAEPRFIQFKKDIEIAHWIIDAIEHYLQRVFFISMPRGMVEASTRAEREPSWVGRNGENIIEILSLIFASRRYDAKAERIVYWTEKFGLGKIKAGYKASQTLASDFYDPILEKDFNLSLASYGSRQLLSIIAQIFWSDPGDVIVIEEPEISLHPESQVLLQELFAEAIRQGKQIIYTTHSPFLILSISKIIKHSQLSMNDVAVHHVEKTSKGTKIKQLELDKSGFIRGWIPSYLKVEDDLFREWAEKIEQD
jgi:predicted ATPase